MAKVVVDNPSFMQLFIIGFAAKKEKIKSPQKPNLRGAPLRGACYKRHECSVWDIYCYLRAHFDSWKLIQHRDNWSGSQTEVKVIDFVIFRQENPQYTNYNLFLVIVIWLFPFK